MKTLSKILTVSLVLISATLMAAPAHSDSVSVVETNKKTLFVFKINDDMKGGEVTVIHSSGEVVTSMEMNKKKIVIDFCDVKFGTYTIKVMKNGKEVESFTYNKELIISQVIR
ncbi:MAG: hypothetical protein KDC99_01050 [Cyclobacteriaceae bacterium]|nr:hypothetical protein [Cyclobacteriaceae bacterium]